MLDCNIVTGALSLGPAMVLLVLALSPEVRAADCSCGYLLQPPSSSTESTLFTQAFETDFLHVKDASRLTAWQPQAYTQDPQAANGPFGKVFEVGNVVANPLEKDHWSGNGRHGGEPGLQLWVNSSLVVGNDGTSSVRCAEIVTARTDIQYGSFSIAMKLSPVNGTCGAFFWYRDDTSEIDMEFLSKQLSGSDSRVNLVIQSPQNGDLGYTAPGSADFDLHALDFDPSSEYVEYRFDWFPGRVDFYADNKLLKSISENVPSAPGRLHVSHWSNGNMGWSAGPPVTDAVLAVSYVKMYFNTSDLDKVASYQKTCNDPEATSRTCQISQQSGRFDPQSSDGNATGSPPFLTNATTGVQDSSTTKVDPSGMILIWSFVVAGMISAIISR